MNKISSFCSLLVCIACLWWAYPVDAARHALVIGIDEYENIDVLHKARNDARAINETLTELGFDVDEELDPDERTFNRALIRLENRIKPGDEVIFHFSGHGVQLDERNWLLPADVPRVNNREQELLKSESIAADTILRRIQNKGARISIMILDACRDNPFPREGTKSVGGSARGLTAITSPPAGSFIFFSAAAEQTALDRLSDNDPSPYSVYTRNLLPLLKNPDLSIQQIARSVERDVRNTASQINHDQRPAYYDELDDDFFLNPQEPVAESDQRAPEPIVTPQAAPSVSPADILWQAILGSKDAAEWRLFATRFPEDPRADLANLRADDIEGSQTAEPQETETASLSPDDVEAGLSLNGDDWRRIQSSLLALGHNPRGVDGRPGANTRAAIGMWQRDQSLVVTGYLDTAQYTRLLAEAAASRVKLAGTVFRDCADCPEMVVIPQGQFTQGSPESETDLSAAEGPQRRVRIGYDFAVGKYEVTFAEWEVCVDDGGCGGHWPDDEGWGRGNRPVINVSWEDAQSYVSWLSGRTGEDYRLLSESEWEYVSRAGTQTRYWWGNEASHDDANYSGTGGRDRWEYTSPVGSFAANRFGLHDTSGNVWEWVEDCWNDSYRGAPVDGSAWLSGNCAMRRLRGGAWGNHPDFLLSALRLRGGSDGRYSNFGFRVARTL